MKFKVPSARDSLADQLRYSPELVAHVRTWSAKFPNARTLFIHKLRADLLRLLGDRELVVLIEVCCYVGQYADPKWHADMRRDVLRSLRAGGIKLPVGKKPRPELAEMVKDLTGLMLAFGIPLATGETSRMVRALRAVHGRLGIDGDPRNELRRLLREAKLARSRQNEAIKAAFDRFYIDPIAAAFDRSLTRLDNLIRLHKGG